MGAVTAVTSTGERRLPKAQWGDGDRAGAGLVGPAAPPGAAVVELVLLHRDLSSVPHLRVCPCGPAGPGGDG